MSEVIKISDREVRFPRSTMDPAFGMRKVITSSPWEFVSLWLRNQKQGVAQVYWDQSKEFFESARNLPTQSASLPLYYSFLNASKSLMEAKGVNYDPFHGVKRLNLRKNTGQRILLENEGLKIDKDGILPSLTAYFSESETDKKYSLFDVLANLAFIHRPLTISYSSPEIFLSIHRPMYVTDRSGVAWFQAELPKEHTNGNTVSTIPKEFRYFKKDEKYFIRTVSTFPWSGARRPTDRDLKILRDFHRKLRVYVNYISGVHPHWYIKRNLKRFKIIKRNNLTLMYMAMHRMSEISRYNPIELGKFLNGRRNLIIHEFVRGAQNQFIDEIAAEITGYEISPAGIRESIF